MASTVEALEFGDGFDVPLERVQLPEPSYLGVLWQSWLLPKESESAVAWLRSCNIFCAVVCYASRPRRSR